ncbi:MAG: M23 family metallopeptidase [Acidimicrobiia bacterium]|nr:M23 family metallopeptidase [Acidimicrobiia bacterium]
MVSIVPLLISALIGFTGIAEPAPGEIADRYDPPRHYGIDIATADRSVVRAVLPGEVSFAGEVADMLAVTIDHGGDVKTTLSFLDAISVSRGQSLVAGTAVGIASGHNGVPGFHLSLRVRGRYVDPSVLFANLVPGRGLRLISPPASSSHNLT